MLSEAFENYGIKDYVVVEKGDVKIAVIGMFGKDALACVVNPPLLFKDPVEGMKDTSYNIINNYLNGANDAVTMLKRVVDYTNTIDKPTVVVFFGDHLPHLDTEFEGYGQLGYDIYGDTIEDELNKHRVPFLIIGNDAYLKDNEPSVNGNIGNISSNFLSTLMLKYMNMDLPPFYDFVDNVFSELQVITPTYFCSNGQYGQLYNDKQLNLINQYKFLQYYNMKEY